MRSDFDTAVAFLLPVCPYTKNKSRQRSNRRAFISKAHLKNRKDSRTGVGFRWHNDDEYSKLSKDQCKELWEWQTTKEDQADKQKYFSSRRRNPPNQRSKNPTKKQLWAKVSSLEKKLEENEITDSKPSGEDDSPSLTEISAAIATASAQATPRVPSKRSECDPYAAAAAAVQAVLKRKRT